MGGVIPEEKYISRAQYLDLFYSQYETLDDFIPNYPYPNTDPAMPPAKTLVDCAVGSIQPASIAKPSKQQIAYSTNSYTPTFLVEVNAIQYSQTSNNKKNGKGKVKKYGNQQDNPNTTTPDNESKPKHKDKYTCLLHEGVSLT